MKHTFAIDPGPEKSAFVLWDGERILTMGHEDNWLILKDELMAAADAYVIERIASYGMPVGREIFETCFWTGRFIERIFRHHFHEAELIERGKVKMHLCHSMRAKDANIRQALIDRLGPPGTKKAQGVTYGVSGDVWAALALAVTHFDLRNNRSEGPPPSQSNQPGGDGGYLQ